jgi:hypothetical protein
MLDESGESQNPDITASGPNGWAVLELTLSPKSKEEDLARYKKIDARYLSNFPLAPHPGLACDTFSCRLGHVEDGANCQLIVQNKLEVYKPEFVRDESLRSALVGAQGSSLRQLPEIPITLLPEMEGEELRPGLAPGVFQIFGMENGKSPTELAHDGLDRFVGKFSTGSVAGLVKKVKAQVDLLIKDFLPPGFLEWRDSRYFAGERWKDLPSVKSLVKGKIEEWAHQTKNVPLSRFFDSSGSTVDDDQR